MKKALIITAAFFMMCGTASFAKSSHKVAAKATKSEKVVAPKEINAQKNGYWIGIQGYGVRIRATPSLRGKIIGSCNWGDSFWCVGYVNGWYKISYGRRYAYVSAQYAG